MSKRSLPLLLVVLALSSILIWLSRPYTVAARQQLFPKTLFQLVDSTPTPESIPEKQSDDFDSEETVSLSPDLTLGFQVFLQDSELRSSIIDTLRQKPPHLLSGENLTITSVRDEGDWKLVSVVASGTNCTSETPGVSECGALMLVHVDETGGVKTALAGTTSFTSLLASVPTSILSHDVKTHLDPLQRDALTNNTLLYKFPWLGAWEYRGSGWHGTFAGLDIGTQSPDKRILAAAGGVIDLVCNDEYSAYVRVVHDDGKTIIYMHFLKDSLRPGIEVGRRVVQGQVFGELRPGTWGKQNSKCGFTEVQGDNSAHIHWGLPTNERLEFDGWSIQYPDKYFRKGSDMIGPGDMIPSTNRVVDLANTGNVGGFVKYRSTGVGVSGALVQIAVGDYIQQRSTDSNGAYHFLNVPAGKATIQALKDGASNSRTVTVVANQTVMAADILLEDNCSAVSNNEVMAENNCNPPPPPPPPTPPPHLMIRHHLQPAVIT